MLSQTQLERLKSLASQASEREGCKLYDLEFLGHGSQRILRVYIDREADQVSVDHCADVSKGLSLLLDVDDVIPGGRYELEVSSPGLERQLKETWHFQKYLGKTIRLKLHQVVKLENPELLLRQFKATLKEADETVLKLEVQGRDFEVPRAQVERAHALFEDMKTGSKKPKR